jgi:IPT/TIG domain
MAQSALTVTVANPTPPTNFSFVGNTPPLDPGQAAVDDGTAGSLTVFEAKTAAASTGGAPGAGISFDHEGKGTEVTVTAPGSIAAAPTIAFSAGPVYNTQALRDAGPNANHASYLSATVTPTITGLSAGGASGAGTTLLTVTGTNFTRASVVQVNGINQTTNFVSATSLTVTNAPKKATSGNVPVTVTSTEDGGVTTAPTNWVFT